MNAAHSGSALHHRTVSKTHAVSVDRHKSEKHLPEGLRKGFLIGMSHKKGRREDRLMFKENAGWPGVLS
jgi:hypothetical protein